MAALNQTDMLALVAVARLGEAAYGVTIREEMRACADRRVSLAAVYDALDRLERRGLARAWLSEPRPERGGRSRRCYVLTATGQSVLQRERTVALRMWQHAALQPDGRRR